MPIAAESALHPSGARNAAGSSNSPRKAVASFSRGSPTAAAQGNQDMGTIPSSTASQASTQTFIFVGDPMGQGYTPE